MRNAQALPLALLFSLATLTACGTRPASPSGEPAAQGGTPTAAAPAASQTATARDGSYEGEILGTVRPGSRFAALRIGMDMAETQQLLGRAPDRLHTYESGKRWIPFYFGNDARRMQVLYKGEGCLTFTGGNVWGAAGGDLIAIHHDATGTCYQP